MCEHKVVPQTRLLMFREADGSVPLTDWLDRLPAKVRTKCVARIERLELFGHELRRPEADLLRDGIHELRIGFQGIHYRILYFFHGEAAILCQGLAKERAVPRREIHGAIRMRAQYISDPDRYSIEE
jgi:hypothetical protein